MLRSLMCAQRPQQAGPAKELNDQTDPTIALLAVATLFSYHQLDPSANRLVPQWRRNYIIKIAVYGASLSLSTARARFSRDFTVPMGIPISFEISSYCLSSQ